MPRNDESRKPSTHKNDRAVSTGEQSKRQLVPNTIHTGLVISISEDGTYAVDLDDIDQTVEGCVNMATVATGLLGFSIKTTIPAGSRVAVICGSTNFISNVIPQGRPDSQGDSRKAVAGDDLAVANLAGLTRGDAPPQDFLEGEIELSNMHGVALTMLQSIAQLKAGESAKIEAHLQNDMIRMIARSFHYLNSLGEEYSWSNGRGNEETLLTGYDHELMGLENEEDERFPMKGDEPDLEGIDRVETVIRARYQRYCGMVGDFIHKIVCDPVQGLGEMAQEALASGKSAIQQHLDGTVIIQSVAEIAIERVTKIPVPVRLKHREDPEVLENLWKDLDKSFLKIWDYGNEDGSEMYRTAYQLRAYARWLSRAQGYARLAQRAEIGEYHIPTEDETPDPEYTNLEKDREDENPTVFYDERYSTIRIMRDGSIVLHDAYGSAVVMSNGNVQVSAARNLELEAAGDVKIVAGQSILMKARRDVEIVATVGGMILKARTWWKGLCEWGSMVFRSDAVNTDRGDEEPTPENEGEDPKPEVLPFAIYFDAPKSQISLRADSRISMNVEGSPYADSSGGTDETKNTSASVVSASRSGGVYLQGRKDIVLATPEDIDLGCRYLTAAGSALYYRFGEYDFKNGIYVSGKTLHVQTIKVNSVQAKGSIQGPKIPGPSPGGGQHFNHIQEVGDVEIEEGEDEEAIKQRNETAALPRSYRDIYGGSNEPKLTFPSKDDYYWDPAEEETGAQIETLTQQWIINDDPDPGKGNGWGDWQWAGERLKFDLRVDTPLLYGAELEHYQSTDGESLREPSQKGPGDQSTEADWSKSGKSLFKFWQRS